VLKVAVLIWLFHPSSLGAIFVYENYIQPFWQQNKQYVEEFEKAAGKVVSDNLDKAKNLASSVAGKKDE
jgi:hypothetical protein